MEGDYIRWLRSIEPESLRRAWLDGDMRALTGMYFRDFRPHGPLIGEEKYNASHVYKPEDVQLEPWFHRWIGMDWGYIHPTSVLFNAKAPWGQIYTYREININRIEPEELGVMLARVARPDIDGLESRRMVVYISPDARAKRQGEESVISLIAEGVQKELGPGSAFVAVLNDEEKLMRSEDALASLERRRNEQKKAQLIFVAASDDRQLGWMHMQTLMRFRPLAGQAEPDTDFAHRLLEEHGLPKYLQYMNQPEFRAAKEALPKWQISSECRLLIAAIPKAMHKPGTNDVLKWDATESAAGDDPLDAARYSLYSEARQGAKEAPLDVRVEKRVQDLAKDMPGLSTQSLWMMERAARLHESRNGRNVPLVMSRNRMERQRAFAARRGHRERTIV